MSEEVVSPCTDICVMDENMVCTGCGMTNEELTQWSKMTNDDRQKVVDRIEEANAAE